MTHVVALSGGKDSTCLALRLREVEPREYVYLCTPTKRELPEMDAHWLRLESLLGQPLVSVTNRTLDDWIGEFDALPNWRQRWCTRLLKIEPTIAFLERHAPVTHYVGLRADEETREGIYGDTAAVTRYPLREWGWGLVEVRRYLRLRGVVIPARTDCDCCYNQRLDEWRALLAKYPERYAHAEALEAKTGATFRSPARDSYPAGLAALRERFQREGEQAAMFEDVDESPVCRACSL